MARTRRIVNPLFDTPRSHATETAMRNFNHIIRNNDRKKVLVERWKKILVVIFFRREKMWSFVDFDRRFCAVSLTARSISARFLFFSLNVCGGLVISIGRIICYGILD